MEENSEKNISDENKSDDFKDFEEEEIFIPELEPEEINQTVPENEQNEGHENDLLKDAEAIARLAKEIDIINNSANTGEEETLQSSISEPEEAEEDKADSTLEPEETEKPSKETDEINPEKEVPVEKTEMITPKAENMNFTPHENNWEETDDDNGAVKKYIFYVSKDFVPIIDSLTTDERTAYINDAIQRKVDSEYEYTSADKNKRILTHLILMILTFFIITPIAIFMVHKSIMMTFKNYKYSQDNFEKLYKERFEHDRAYMRSVEYNKRHKNDEEKEK